MNRRTYLGLLATATLAGCSSDGNPTQTATPERTPLVLSATDATATSPDVSLDVAYAATTTTEIPTDPPTVADEGTRWLFVRMQVTNTAEAERSLTGSPFIVSAGGETSGIVATGQEWDLRGQTLEAGATTTGWLVFQIPADATEATLTVRDDTSATYDISFTQDSSLNTTLP